MRVSCDLLVFTRRRLRSWQHEREREREREREFAARALCDAERERDGGREESEDGRLDLHRAGADRRRGAGLRPTQEVFRKPLRPEKRGAL